MSALIRLGSATRVCSTAFSLRARVSAMKPSIKSLLISRPSPAGVIRFDCLHQIDVIEMALRANRFGGHSELVAERSGESFVGAITEIQSDSQDVSTTVRKHARCLAQSPAAHVAHRRLAGRPNT